MAIATATDSKVTVVAKGAGVSVLEVGVKKTLTAVPKVGGHIDVGGTHTVVVGGGKATILEARTTEQIAVGRQEITVVATGVQGPEGYSQPAGEASVEYTSSETLNMYSPVIATGGLVAKADQSDLTHLGKVLGLALTSATAGGTVRVLQIGRVVNPTWSWLPGPIYLGVGVLTQVPATNGILQVLAVAVSATEILVAVKQPFQL
ncbi:MAG: hypothetical protein KAG66_00490 [Methylococcales bacterium]|nr:hypothetical protein [Methylococcales bacterium]